MVAVIDQAILSATNLIIGLLFIRLATKVDYGVYAQLFTALLLAQSIHSALISGPLVTLGGKRRARGMQSLAAHLFRVQTVISLILVVVAFLGIKTAALGFELPALSTEVAIAFALALGGLWLREFVREIHFVQLKPHRTLVVDLLYVAVVGLGLLVASVTDHFSSATVFAVIALGNLVAGSWGLARSGVQPFANHGRARKPLRESWQLARWSLPGVGVTWGNNYSFPYIVALVLGATAVADVFAARLLLMPAGLCVVAWVSVFLPRASRWVGQGDFATLRRAQTLSVMGLWALVGLYFGALMLLYAPLETYVLGEQYAGLQMLAAAWAVFFAANALRQAGTLALVAGGYYRQLFWYSVAAIVVSIPVVVVLTFKLGRIGPMLGLVVGELLVAAMAWVHGWPMLKREWTPKRSDEAAAAPVAGAS